MVSKLVRDFEKRKFFNGFNQSNNQMYSNFNPRLFPGFKQSNYMNQSTYQTAAIKTDFHGKKEISDVLKTVLKFLKNFLFVYVINWFSSLMGF